MHKQPLLAVLVLSAAVFVILGVLIVGSYYLGLPAYIAAGVSVLFCLLVGQFVPRYMKWWDKLWET